LVHLAGATALGLLGSGLVCALVFASQEIKMKHETQSNSETGVLVDSDQRIEGRSLRPIVCSCYLGCRSREEMQARHGDPEAFLASLERAFEAGNITFHEAERANLKYRAEWHGAPERATVDKSSDERNQKRRR
jgi:hypothetical protein